MADFIPSTGIPGFDKLLNNLQSGDNVVFLVDDINNYKYFAQAFLQQALKENHKVIYMRFAQHDPIIEDTSDITVYTLDAFDGFESFSMAITNIISKEGYDVYYIFDCLSDLLNAWATDLMVRNFFSITCPYLYKLNTVAYFAIIGSRHSFRTISGIRKITQLLLDLSTYQNKIYMHPLKVFNRYSPTMFLPHVLEGEEFIPITRSSEITNLSSELYRQKSLTAKRSLDYWDRLFLEAEELMNYPGNTKEEQNLIDRLCRVMIGTEERILKLVKANFSLEDLLKIKDKLIGTGYIGGKAVGMLLARKILENDTSFNWKEKLEPHDSYYIGSDVFHTYIVMNGLWMQRVKQKTKEGYFTAARELKARMLEGSFPDSIVDQFQQMLDYFGQFPIIVRSSSLLEDSFGNAFAGKYESLFLVNKGTPEQRFEQFINAVRRIYASTMDEDALAYRKQRGLDHLDEQMALLVQRVSGAYYKHYFFPYAAGVGVSYNTFVWKNNMDPKAGMLRLVFGLGTRAVNRIEGDYAKIAALDHPLMNPHATIEDTKRFSQHEVDLLNINENAYKTVDLEDLFKENLDIDMELVGTPDKSIQGYAGAAEGNNNWIITFDNLLSKTDFAPTMQRMLKKLEEAYNYPVDTEFTINFFKDNQLSLNLVQCRPLQTRGIQNRVEIPEGIDENNIFFKSEGSFLGGSIMITLKKIIMVDPKSYIDLPLTNKFDIARLVGKINRTIKQQEEEPTILLGPGRWGTSTPSMGVPVRFSDINNITALVEIAFSSDTLVPELSYGTHFFHDLVETNIFYIAIFPEKTSVVFNLDWLAGLPNLIEEIDPFASKYKDVIKVYDVSKNGLQIASDIMSQKVLCYTAACALS